jgi:raffinose/stachyose/melibiose transport system permease protein
MSADLPETIHFEYYSTVIERGKLGQSFLNSMLYASTASFISLIFASTAAYVLSRNKNRLNRFIYFFIVMGIAMPLNFFTLTKVMQISHLINTQLGIIILYAATQIPFNVFLIYGFVDAIPRELDEAAIIDGCGSIRLFSSVILPLLMPVLVTAGVLNFVGIWNDFLLPLYYLNNSAYWPMTLAVYNFFGQFQQDWNLVSADIVLTVLPVLFIYLLGQRFIVSGLTAGAVKG